MGKKPFPFLKGLITPQAVRLNEMACDEAGYGKAFRGVPERCFK